MEFKEQLNLDDFKAMYHLEAAYYEETYITPYQESYRWYLAFPWSNCCLVDGEVLVGFLDMFPISEDLFNQIKVGEFNDSDLKTQDIVDVFSMPKGPVHMFLSCIVIHKDYRKTDALTMLLKKQVAFYKHFIEKGLQVEWIITDNVTKEGEGFSRRLGFIKETISSHDSVINISDYKGFAKRIEEL